MGGRGSSHSLLAGGCFYALGCGVVGKVLPICYEAVKCIILLLSIFMPLFVFVFNVVGSDGLLFAGTSVGLLV